MTTPIKKLVLMFIFLVNATQVSAQAPIQFTNSKEAIRQYEESTFEGLRERCKVKPGTDLAARDELTAIREGFVAINTSKQANWHYEVFAFDAEKRTFFLIDGQSLRRDIPLQIKLALPRDFARCRIIQSPHQPDQLEIVHIERNYPGDTQKMRALLARAREFSTSSQEQLLDASCLRFPAGSPAQGADRIIIDAKDIRPNACHAGLLDTHERMAKLIRKVFER